MQQESPSQRRRQFLKITFLILWGLSVAAFFEYRSILRELGYTHIYKYLRAEQVGWVSLSVFTILVLMVLLKKGRSLFAVTEKIIEKVEPKRLLASTLILLFTLTFYGAFFLVIPNYLTGTYIRLWFFTFSILGATLSFDLLWKEKSLLTKLVFSALLLAYYNYCLSYLSGVTNYPFSLGWSETSRYYHASLYLDKLVYGMNLPLPHRDFSRYLMQAVPFLIPHSQLWMHRLWQALLRGLLPVLTVYLLAKKIGLDGRLEKAIFILWGSIFLMQAPVFYAMLVVVILMLAWFKSDKFFPALFVVFLVSIWAGITRINWIPVPGLMAALFYFLERPLKENTFKGKLKYLVPPFIWFVIGTLTGLASLRIYQLNSGLDLHMFATTFTADLLWYRLLPNVSYPLGVLTGILLVSSPILLYTILRLRGRMKQWHGLRLLGILAITAGLFLGGLVVSVKIGGGTNLHNMDSFITIILIFFAYLYYNRFVKDFNGPPDAHSPNLVLIAILAVPVVFSFNQMSVSINKNITQPSTYIEKIQNFVDDANQDDGEILFIAERQLITFKSIENVQLVNDYEKIVLMEMALGRNQTYLKRFDDDLRNHRFSLIVTDIIARYYKEPGIDSLAEENNINVDSVVKPLTCYYDSVNTIRELGIEIWMPKTTNTCP